MASNIELDATARPGVGKGAARQARRDGMVPGVIYGGNADPESINIKQNVLLKQLKAGKFLSTLIKISVDGTEQTVICRAVQRDVVKDLPIHADFLRLSERSRINLMIPVEFTNEEESPGIKKGGVLTVVRNEVELRVRANNIPEQLEADLAGLEVNDVIRISDIKMPEGSAPTISDRDFMIANISAPSALTSAEAEEDEGEATEGEGAAAEAAEGGEE
ncbi:MAG: 50S ribosomal protein L25/general stress protein Ctc [Paracoccaceae bacterium]